MNETVPDQWQYQIPARIPGKKRVIYLTDSRLEPVIRAMKMEYAPTLEEAFAMAGNQVGNVEITANLHHAQPAAWRAAWPSML